MQRGLKLFLILEALLFLFLVLLGLVPGNEAALLFSFPFAQLGLALRFLSLSGPAGNGISVIIYCALSLLPLFFFAMPARAKRLLPEDGLLPLISALVFVVLYYMINPAYLVRHFGPQMSTEFGKAFLGLAVYSALLGYLIFRGLRLIKESEPKSRFRYLKLLLAAICILLVYEIFGSGLAGLLAALSNLAQGNTMPGQSLLLSHLFLILQYLVGALPPALGLAIVCSASELVDLFENDPYGEAISASAKRIGRILGYAVTLIILSQIILNALQLALGSLVLSSRYTFNIPLLPIVFMLVAMLFARYLEETKKIKDDHDMFV